MVEDPDSPVPKRVPKYKAPDFMRKEIELWMRGRNETMLMRRNGDNDDPIEPVASVRPIHGIRAVTEINRTIR
jgi:hypothetical protein